MTSPLSLTIDQVSVTGLITLRTASDLVVAISHPWAGFQLGAPHIPRLAAGHKDYRDKQWDALASQLLSDLYRAVSSLKEHSSDLCEAYQQPDSLRDRLDGTREELVAVKHQKQQARQQFAEGLLSQRDYQSGLRQLSKVEQHFQELAEQAKSDFLRQHLPESCTALQPDDVLNWLESQLHSTNNNSKQEEQ
ncbi:hypothetical protein [Parendozoicomonas haliclonae]|uniref:Uncharacterized protein n=1 Tax=Parendozoicomonas haliclonae TaxID=1960125 RepID=A0A1X7AR80_9GAMM|nr:hypothetical protein [Parendozoicomonas haliclonae]SMA50824.1 hypothetical protein EHSB41UT_04641 [Parendozoicomonas haliclonae]